MNILEFLDRYFSLGGLGGADKRAALYTQTGPIQFADEDAGADRAVPMSQYDELLAAYAESGAVIDELWNQLDDAEAKHGALLAVNVALVGVLFILGMTYTLIHLV